METNNQPSQEQGYVNLLEERVEELEGEVSSLEGDCKEKEVIIKYLEGKLQDIWKKQAKDGRKLKKMSQKLSLQAMKKANQTTQTRTRPTPEVSTATSSAGSSQEHAQIRASLEQSISAVLGNGPPAASTSGGMIAQRNNKKAKRNSALSSNDSDGLQPPKLRRQVPVNSSTATVSSQRPNTRSGPSQEEDQNGRRTTRKITAPLRYRPDGNEDSGEQLLSDELNFN